MAHSDGATDTFGLVSSGSGSGPGKWSVEQVEALAPSAAAFTAALPLATAARWLQTGADDRAVWGSSTGSGSEPYDTVVDHVGVGYRCTCPSRKVPCKHALALLLLWARDLVPPGVATTQVEQWIVRRDQRAESSPPPSGSRSAPAEPLAPDRSRSDGRLPDDSAPAPAPAPEPDRDEDRDQARDERVERMMAGLTELDRWLDDRMRTGLADPALAQYSTWDDLAARLVDAQAGSLANRIRRLAGLVGASPNWQDDVLAELGMLHLLAQAGRRIGELPDALADAVATTVGWQVRQADVLGGVPDTDEWIVAGRSDRREDRIEVRRVWLRGRTSSRWALVLSFAAYQQSLDVSLPVGSCVHADLHRYPGSGLRSLVGRRYADPAAALFPQHDHVPSTGRPPGQSISAACDEIGTMLVAEPWLDRVPTSLTASVSRAAGAWCLVDATGSLPLLGGESQPIATLLAVSAGSPVDLTIEWTPHGVLPLSIHLDDRTIDIGPRADASFVGAT